MRYALLKKRRVGLIFIILLMSLAISLLAIGSPHLLNSFKIYIQKKIAKDFNIEVEVGEISGGFIRPITFKDVCILRKKNGFFVASLKTNALLPNYRIWDLALAQVFGYKELVLMLDKGRLYLNSQEPVLSHINGQIMVDEGQIENINLIARHKADKLSLAGKIKRFEKTLNLDLKLAFIKQPTKTILTLRGPLKKLELKGEVFLLDEKKIDFKSQLTVANGKIAFENADFNQFYLAEGWYNFKNNEFSAQVFSPQAKEKLLTIDFTPLDEGEVQSFLLKLNFNHFNLFERDVVSLLEAKGKLFNHQDKKARLAIELLTYGTIINHQPAEELEISCNYEGNVLDIVSARVGSQSSASGTIDFNKRPPEIKLLWNVEKINFTDLLAVSNEESATEGSYLEGGLSGKIYIENSLLDPFIKIALEGEKGIFWGVKFERANINLKGNYPILAFHDSRVYREEGGFFILDGKIDLREIGKRTFFDDVKILSDKKTIVLDGWDIARGIEQSEITLKKAVSEDLKVGFKTFINDKMQDLSNESDALELEYKLQGNRALFMRFEKDEELFGVRHKLKF